MIIDINAALGAYPFRRLTRTSADEIVTLMDRNGIVWVLEFARAKEGEVDPMGAGSELTSRILGFNTGVQFMGYYTAVLSVPALLKIFG